MTGSSIRPGQTVIVDVSTGPVEVNIPDTVGMSVQHATQVLQAAGFLVQTQTYGLSGNRVWGYSPVGQAPRGSTIILEILPLGGGL